MHRTWGLIVLTVLIMKTCQGWDCDVDPRDIVSALGDAVNATCLLRDPAASTSLYWTLNARRVPAGLAFSARPGSLSVSLPALPLSPPSGNNLECFKADDAVCNGIVVYVGEPPASPLSVSCETPDLVSLSCVWKPGNRTHVGKFTPRYNLTYSSGNRSATVAATEAGGNVRLLDRLSGFSVTVTTQNLLGVAAATETFLTATHALVPSPPQGVTVDSSDPFALNVSWMVTPDLGDLALNFEACANIGGIDDPLCATLPLLPEPRGRRPHLLLWPVPPYWPLSVRVRARGPLGAAGQWGPWGPWGQAVALRSAAAVPLVTPDLWRMLSVTSAGDKMAAVMWKEVGDTEARGKVRSYSLCLPECREFPSPPATGWPLPPGLLPPIAVTIRVTNEAGASPPATIVITPGDYITASVPAERLVGTTPPPSSSSRSPSLRLSWPPSPSPCGLVVQWSVDTKTGDRPCSVAVGNISGIVASNGTSRIYWKRIGANETAATLGAEGELEPYVRYAVCVYACARGGACALVKAAHAYLQESTPVAAPAVSVRDVSEDSATLGWEPVPEDKLRGFLTEYRLTWRDEGGLLNELSVRDSASPRVVVVSGLSPGTNYRFSMAAVTARGAGPEGDLHPLLTKYSSSLAWIIAPVCLSVTLGVILSVIICFYRQRVKNVLCPPTPSLFNLAWLREFVETKPRPVSASPPVSPCFTDADPCSLEIVSSCPQSPVSPASSCLYGCKLGDTETRGEDTGVVYSTVSQDSSAPAIGGGGSQVVEERREFARDPACLPVSSYMPQRTSS